MTIAFEGKRVLVTGASSGIGEAVTTDLLARGAQVICVARKTASLQRIAARFPDMAIPLAADLSSQTAIEALVDEVRGMPGGLDILVNNAGHNDGGSTDFAAGNHADWNDILAVNLGAMMQLTHGLIPLLRARPPGHVLNVGSIVSRMSAPNMAAYMASKHGVHGFCEALRADYDDGSLRVTEIIPGTVRTGFAERRWGGRSEGDAFYDRMPSHLTADDIARSIVWALGQPASVTVNEIVVTPTRRR
jgi:3-hydroxy acid dehydrogenase / malonic semialdehyde reductase